MEIILLQRVPKLGDLGEKVRVKPGFARNYLIPQRKGLPATKANLEEFEKRRVELEKAATTRVEEAKARALALESIKITVAAHAGEEGRLFGSVGAYEIVRAAIEQGYKIAKSEVRLPSGPIRQIGEYEVDLHLLGDEVTAKILLSVISA